MHTRSLETTALCLALLLHRTFRQYLSLSLCCFAPLFKSDFYLERINRKLSCGWCVFIPALLVADICELLARSS